MTWLKRWFKRRPVDRDEIRAKAAARLAMVSTHELVRMSETQLSAAWQAFDGFQDHPEQVTLNEYAKAVSVLQGTVDALQDRFEQAA